MAPPNDKLTEIINQFRTSPLAKHAEALGHLCMAWSRLELSVNALLFEMMNGDDASAVVVLNMEFREKLRTIKALAFHRMEASDWYTNVCSEIANIDDKLRNERNRMIHDTWHAKNSEALRFTHFAKVINKQARQPQLAYGAGKKISASEIQVLSIKILAAQGSLMDIHGRYCLLRDALPDKP